LGIVNIYKLLYILGYTLSSRVKLESEEKDVNFGIWSGSNFGGGGGVLAVAELLAGADVERWANYYE